MENITLSPQEYEKLLQSSMELQALKNFGVDNWSGYSEAMKSLEEDAEEGLQ
jgi:hypothetical protein